MKRYPETETLCFLIVCVLFSLCVRLGAAEAGSARISGRVMYAGKPLAGVVLRLVRADNFAFIPGISARADDKGCYSFGNVQDGNYRVYAYTGDNPGYFNRTTSVIRLGKQPAKADDIQMGRVIDAQDPPRGAILSPQRDMVFTWTGCPCTAHYHLSVIDPATNEEVFSAETAKPYCTVPVSRFNRGPIYEWRIVATDSDSTFLGGTPGAGRDPLVFSIASD